MNLLLPAVMLLSLSALLYTWMLFPFLLRIMTGARQQDSSTVLPLCPDIPLIVLIAAYNEEKNIAARVRNLLDIDYPTADWHVLIGTDGCTDQTAALVKESVGTSSHIRMIEFGNNRGKASVLKDLVHTALSETDASRPPLLIFSDANTVFHKDALKHLVQHFADPHVGGVCGRLVFQGGGQEEYTYWDFETRLKQAESVLDSCLGANGAIYAIRSECFWNELPPNTIVDDFVIGMKVREYGYRMQFEAFALAYEEMPGIKAEWNRRVRIGSGDYQALLLCRRCLSFHYGRFAWCFWSHKVMRWFSPHLALIMISAAVSSIIAGAFVPLTQPTRLLSLVIIYGAVLLCATAAAGRLWRSCGEGSTNRIYAVCLGADHFLTMQAALFCGFIRFCRGGLDGHWTRTPRQETPHEPIQ